VTNGERDERPPLEGERGYGLKLCGTKAGQDEMVDPGVRRYIRAIRACGPYYKVSTTSLLYLKASLPGFCSNANHDVSPMRDESLDPEP
jgi:hypothetical protein